MKRINERETTMRFGEKVASPGTGLGVSQEEVAFRTEIHRTHVSLIETKARSSSLSTIVALAGALGQAVEALFAGISFEPTIVSRGRFVIGSPGPPASEVGRHG